MILFSVFCIHSPPLFNVLAYRHGLPFPKQSLLVLFLPMATVPCFSLSLQKRIIYNHCLLFNSPIHEPTGWNHFSTTALVKVIRDLHITKSKARSFVIFMLFNLSSSFDIVDHCETLHLKFLFCQVSRTPLDFLLAALSQQSHAFKFQSKDMS